MTPNPYNTNEPEQIPEALAKLADTYRKEAETGPEFWGKLADVMDRAARCAEGQVAWAKHRGELSNQETAA